ncbi:hypothetical protein PFISCL1PPCAC_18418, partial [Pristionchus fissidentatus]
LDHLVISKDNIGYAFTLKDQWYGAKFEGDDNTTGDRIRTEEARNENSLIETTGANANDRGVLYIGHEVRYATQSTHQLGATQRRILES